MPQILPITTAANLLPGQVYRVTAAFTDYDGIRHPIGEIWRFLNKSFLPYEDGLTLEVEQDGQQQLIRLQWRPESQAEIIEGFARYVEPVGSVPATQAVLRGNRKRPWWSCFAIGAATLAAIACLGVAGYFFYLLKALEYKPSTIDVDTAGITVELDAPISVDVGQDFTLAVRVGNSREQNVLLDSLMIDDKTINAVAVKGSDPAFIATTPFEQIGNYLRYDFQRPIPANGSLVVQFELTAQQSGTYQGQVQVCTQTEENCTLHPWMLIVK